MVAVISNLVRHLAKAMDIERLRSRMAKAAQKVYDEWDEGRVEELGDGGICQDIADALVEVLDSAGIEASPVSAGVGDQHVYAVAKTKEGVFEVDINPRIYEKDGGYTWEKIPGVRFDPGDISISLLDDDPEEYSKYIED